MYAQIIDDTVGKTLVSASTLDKEVKAELEKTNNVEAAAAEGNEKAILALKAYDLNIAQFIAKYMVSMGGADTIVFTAGVGENQFNRRASICEKLEFLGVKLDTEKNKIKGEEVEISTPDSKIKVYVVPTNEELVIARETLNLIK